MIDQPELTALRERVEQLTRTLDIREKALREMHDVVSERDAATARAERAEEALGNICCVARTPEEADSPEAAFELIERLVQGALDDHSADASKTVGERELTDSALQESWDKMAGVQWSETGTLMIERNTGKTVVVPKISERERRLTNLLAHMTDAYELAYGEDCPLVKQSRAALAEMEQKS